LYEESLNSEDLTPEQLAELEESRAFWKDYNDREKEAARKKPAIKEITEENVVEQLPKQAAIVGQEVSEKEIPDEKTESMNSPKWNEDLQTIRRDAQVKYTKTRDAERLQREREENDRRLDNPNDRAEQLYNNRATAKSMINML
ncbi:MAG: hypothetical protein JO129_04560, partial [Candidatus Dependentiae bacterium]|nr:hypothetical protein [Candidatus Dependentiae bacterium]